MSCEPGQHDPEQWDAIVIGSGPAGQKAAVQAAKGNQRTCVVEREVGVGGACVHRGTIPSKTLRETALHIGEMRNRLGAHIKLEIPKDLQLATLMVRMEHVITAHVDYQREQMSRNGIEQIHGRARFVDAKTMNVEGIHGDVRTLTAPTIVIATGSRPRTPPNVAIDHEHIYDSDSILSMAYLPTSLTVLGGGVIASEYATIFASLGVEVTMIDRAPRPLGFLDQEILDRFVTSFESRPGCRFLGSASVKSAEWDGVSEVVTTLEDGQEVRSQKLLCALGRVANVDGLDMEAAGLETNKRGQIDVDLNCQTAVPGIYAAGDVIGPPSLASASMEQGRRAMRAALEMSRGSDYDMLPSGIYTIPEIAMVGLSERDQAEAGRDVLIGRACFSELARGQISASQNGMLKLVVDAESLQVLGCQILGEGATELVHLAQLAMINKNDVRMFVENIFNFPTLAEAYRVAGLDIIGQITANPAESLQPS